MYRYMKMYVIPMTGLLPGGGKKSSSSRYSWSTKGGGGDGPRGAE